MFVYFFEEISSHSQSDLPPTPTDLAAIGEGMLVVIFFDKGTAYRVNSKGDHELLADSPLDSDSQFHIHKDDPYGRSLFPKDIQSMQIEVIYTFYEAQQQVSCLEFASAPTQTEFLKRAILNLSPSEREELAKISACQFVSDEQIPMKWILETGGKFYFEEGTAADILREV